MKNIKSYVLTGLRVIVGWHFLFEGISKMVSPGWTAKYYLLGSKWIFSGLFHQMAGSDSAMKIVDSMNMLGLTLVGLSLFLGLFVRWSSIAGAVLLLFYFFAYPPIPGYTMGVVSEGSYLWVNKTLIEFFLMVLFVVLPSENFFGTDRWIKRWKEEKARAPIPASDSPISDISHRRRELIRDLIGVPALGAFAYALYRKHKWDSFEERFLADPETDATSGATVMNYTFSSIDELKGKVPAGKIGDLEISRMIMGGNLIGGWAHARDLIYVSKLVKAYHSDLKVMQTLDLGEKCGINVILANPQLSLIINRYRHETNSKIKFISDCGVGNDFIKGIKQSIVAGADAMYCQGELSDRLVRSGDFDVIARGIEMIRSEGKPAGVGAHRIETIRAVTEQGIRPDFWVKTLHSHNYWSAQPNADYHDNMFCFKPQETIDFMNTLQEPWIAFKVLAAGAIHPGEGFQFAFDNGADFICVGMYDFQIVENCNTIMDTLVSVNRTRPWCG
jgi:uncharacterized membrane protein YphA (DoxX/SURF4 family)